MGEGGGGGGGVRVHDNATVVARSTIFGLPYLL
jgi:hypothetical protein